MRAINQDISETIKLAEIRDKLAANDTEAAAPNASDDSRKFGAGETIKWGRLIEKLGIKFGSWAPGEEK